MAERQPGKLAVILHADVAGSTDLVRQNEQLAHERIQNTFRRFGDTITKYHGFIRELRGDALLAEFERASDAVTAALAFQDDQLKYLSNLNDSIQPAVRVGIAMGEVIIADDTITGEGVVLAQRLEQQSEPGAVVIQGAAYETIPGRFPFEYDNLGKHEVKGFDEPVRVYGARLKGGTDLPQPTPTVHRARNTIIAFASVAVIASGVVLMWFRPWETRVEPASVERMAFPLPEEASIAVLPFQNLSDDPKQEYFTDGLTNDIITDLSRMKDLFVIASNSTFTYKGKPVKVQQVAEELGVRYVLEGSVQKTGDTIRINAQLIDAVSGRHLWADRYDRDASDLFAVQVEIIEMIVATLAFKVDTVERERVLQKDTENLAAYELYRRGREAFFVWTKESMAQARTLSERAIELDPNYAQPYGLMARILGNQARYGWVEDPNDTRDLAVEMGQKAVALNPGDYYSHWELGGAYMFQGDFDQSIGEYERALELNPNDADLLAEMVELLGRIGRADDAVVQIKRAMRINPHYPDWYLWNLGWAQYLAGQYEEALDALNRMSNPPNGVRRISAAVLVRLGRIDEAREVIEAFIADGPDTSLSEMKKWRFQHRAYLDKWIDDLRTAGWTEHLPLKLPEKPSIAVLPFTNMSNDPQQEYFVDGMTEDLITDLSKISGLFVIARNSSFTYKGKAVDVKNVARDLGVRYVLEGSVRRAGDQVRINAQLIDATTGGHLWAERYDGTLADVFDLQDKVTKHIVDALALELTPRETQQVSDPGTNNVDAHDAFLKGRDYYRRQTPQDMKDTIEFYKRALEHDPNYAEAAAMLAQTMFMIAYSNWGSLFGLPNWDEATAESVRYADIALSLDPQSGLANTVKALTVYFTAARNLDDALTWARKGIDLAPNSADAHLGLGIILVRGGEPEQAIPYLEKSLRLDPENEAQIELWLARAYFGMEQYAEAEKHALNARKHAPKNTEVWLELAAIYGQQDELKKAASAIETLNALLKAGFQPKYSTGFDSNLTFLFYREKKDENRFRQGLLKAGILD